MQLYLRLAWRNVWRHRRRTIIIVIAMGMTMALMMWYDGLMNGFTDAIYGNAVKVLGGNIQVHAAGYRAQASSTPLLPLADPQAVIKAAEANPLTLGATQRINTGGLVTSQEGAFSVGITGIEPEKELSVNIIGQNVKTGRDLTSADMDNILIGKGLADAMGVQVGDRITLVGSAQHAQMRQRTMTVIGIYDLGIPDLEKQTVYISLGEAQALYGLPGQSTEVAIFLKQLGEEKRGHQRHETQPARLRDRIVRGELSRPGFRDQRQEQCDGHFQRNHHRYCGCGHSQPAVDGSLRTDA